MGRMIVKNLEILIFSSISPSLPFAQAICQFVSATIQSVKKGHFWSKKGPFWKIDFPLVICAPIFRTILLPVDSCEQSGDKQIFNSRSVRQDFGRLSRPCARVRRSSTTAGIGCPFSPSQHGRTIHHCKRAEHDSYGSKA